MISPNDYALLQELKVRDPSASKLLEDIRKDHSNDLSAVSHTLKNSISFLYSSYQLLSEHYPQTKEYLFWEDVGDAINQMIKFLDHLSAYNHCYCSDYKKINLNNLLYELPDEADSILDTDADSRTFHFDTDNEDIEIDIDYHTLKRALTELVVNGCEATDPSDTITISAHVQEDSDSVAITISNPDRLHSTNLLQVQNDNLKESSTEYHFNMEQISTPFFTTKSDHAGLGLSIASIVSVVNNGNLSLTKKENMTHAKMVLPLTKPESNEILFTK